MTLQIPRKLSILLSLFLVAVISSFITYHKVQSDAVLNHVNVILYDLNTDMDLLEYWEKEHNDDSYLEEKIKYLILNKLIILSVVNPEIEDLQGTPLEALYRLIIYYKKSNISLKQYNDLSQTALNYLTSIEGDVVTRIKKRNEIFSNAQNEMKKKAKK